MVETKKFGHFIAIKAAVEHMILSGVTGSDRPVMEHVPSKAVQLAKLLSYSPELQWHENMMVLAFLKARVDKISGEIHDSFEVNPEVDIVFRDEGPNLVYYFAAGIEKPIEQRFGDSAFFNLSIMENNDNRKGFWSASYHASFMNDTSRWSVGSSNLQPERSMALEFLFAPRRLDGKYFADNFPAAAILKRYIGFAGETQTNSFRRFWLSFDGLSQSDEYKKMRMIDNLHNIYANYLIRRGNFNFPIVELGTLDIEGQTFWIYSGSEMRIPTDRSRQVWKRTRSLFS